MPNWTPVSRKKHATLRWRRRKGFMFAQSDTVVEICLSEIPKLLPNYVLGILKTTDVEPKLVALLGFGGERNLYVNQSGQWLCETVPLDLLTHPFKLFTNSDTEERVLCVDEDHIDEEPESIAFFDSEGGMSEHLTETLNILNKRDLERKRTRKACELILEKEIVEPWSFKFDLGNGEEIIQFEGLHNVNREKLGSAISELVGSNCGVLATEIAFGQTFSVNQINQLGRRLNILSNEEAKRKSLSIDVQNIITSDNTLNFDNL